MRLLRTARPSNNHFVDRLSIANAKVHGAAAVLLVNDPINHEGDSDRLLSFGDNLGAEDLDIPVVHVKRYVAGKLLRASGRDLATCDIFPLRSANCRWSSLGSAARGLPLARVKT